MSSDAARTKQATGAAAEAKDAMAAFARAAEPRAAARRLTLLDHVFVTGALHRATFRLAYALQHTANGIQFCYSEHGERDRGGDLQRVLIRAATRARRAAEKAHGPVDDTTADAVKLSGQLTATASFPLRRASHRASQAVEGLERTLNDRSRLYGVRLYGFAEITYALSDMTGDLLSVFGNESMLLDGVYEDAGLGRRAARAAGPLASGLGDLRLARRCIAVAQVDLRDDVAVGIRRTRRRTA